MAAIVRVRREGAERLVRNQANCTVYKRLARFESTCQIRVGDNLLTAYNDFEIVAANLLDSEGRQVGLSEAKARATGKRFTIGPRPMTQAGRAVEKGETLDFMKIIVDADTHDILGAAILGTEGDEAVHGILDTMYAKRATGRCNAPCISTPPSRS